QLKIQSLSEPAMLVRPSLLRAGVLPLWVLPFISRVMALPLGPGMRAPYNEKALRFAIFRAVTFLGGFSPPTIGSASNPI
uniref:hypothetical protein n=1 Tax=Chitinophaga sp. GbtcB8 TaxID=2824753 RepID=UPI001C2FE3C0